MVAACQDGPSGDAIKLARDLARFGGHGHNLADASELGSLTRDAGLMILVRTAFLPIDQGTSKPVEKQLVMS